MIYNLVTKPGALPKKVRTLVYTLTLNHPQSPSLTPCHQTPISILGADAGAGEGARAWYDQGYSILMKVVILQQFDGMAFHFTRRNSHNP